MTHKIEYLSKSSSLVSTNARKIKWVFGKNKALKFYPSYIIKRQKYLFTYLYIFFVRNFSYPNNIVWLTEVEHIRILDTQLKISKIDTFSCRSWQFRCQIFETNSSSSWIEVVPGRIVDTGKYSTGMNTTHIF